MIDDELFHAGQARAIRRAFDAASAKVALRAIEREIAVALQTPEAPDKWIDGIENIGALIREVFPEPSSPQG